MNKKIRFPSDDFNFLGLNDSSSSESSEDEENMRSFPYRSSNPITDPRTKLFHGDILSGLPNWLDRVFDGSLPRIRVDSWPKMSVEEEIRSNHNTIRSGASSPAPSFSSSCS